MSSKSRIQPSKEKLLHNFVQSYIAAFAKEFSHLLEPVVEKKDSPARPQQ